MDIERVELLARIAELYYQENQSQEQIAAQTGYSRSMISRYLSQARQEGVVEIHVHHPLRRLRELEQALQAASGLEQVWVLQSANLEHPEMLRRLGGLAARLVEECTHDDRVIGISWGTAMHEMVTAIRPRAYRNIHVVQMVGALGTPNPEIDGPELARRLARTLNGRYTTMPVPLMVDSESTRAALLSSLPFRRILGLFQEITLALVGVGTVEAEQASLLRAGYLTENQLHQLQSSGAVGDVCAIHFDQAGDLIHLPITHCMMSIEHEMLKAIPDRIGVAGGRYKAAPIVGASRAGLINRLVTDEAAAIKALELF